MSIDCQKPKERTLSLIDCMSHEEVCYFPTVGSDDNIKTKLGLYNKENEESLAVNAHHMEDSYSNSIQIGKTLVATNALGAIVQYSKISTGGIAEKTQTG